MRTATALFAYVLLASAAPGSEADPDQELGPAAKADPGLLDESGRPQPRRTSLTDEQRAGMIDKGRIAEETARKVVGLREAGNPHIPGDLLISKIEEDPEAVQVDDNLLRERLITQLDRHSSYADTVRDRSCQPRDEEPDAAEQKPDVPQRGSGLRRALLAIAGIGLIAGAALLLALRSGKR
jgi:hypothetical protein